MRSYCLITTAAESPRLPTYATPTTCNRFLVILMIIIGTVAGFPQPTHAGIVGIVPGSNTITVDFDDRGAGGGKWGLASPLPEWPDYQWFSVVDPVTGDSARETSNYWLNGNIYGIGSWFSFSQPAGVVGRTQFGWDAAVTFQMDGAGLAAHDVYAFWNLAGEVFPPQGVSYVKAAYEVTFTSASLGLLRTLQLDFETHNVGQFATFEIKRDQLPDLPANDTLQLRTMFRAEGDPFNISGSINVPEIDPAGMGSVVALVTGALGLLERRRLKIG